MSDYAHAIMAQMIRANADSKDLMQEIAQAIDSLPKHLEGSDCPDDHLDPSDKFDYPEIEYCAEWPEV